MILGQGNNSKGKTILICKGVKYAILCQKLGRCPKMLHNSIACFHELHTLDVSVLLRSASVIFNH
jgi:hypothetical protein